MDDIKREEMMKRAHTIGTEHGKSAASWVFDGNRDKSEYIKILTMIEDGDPEVYDMLPNADLSGEWADGYSGWDLAKDLGLEDSGDDYFDSCEEYEMGFNDAVVAEVSRVCRYHLGLDDDLA